MKRFPIFSILSLALLIVLFSCEKETILSVDQSSVEISDAGGSQTVSLTANKPWTASSNQSWCKVSPSAGEEATNSRITITCDPNTTYDARNCTVTFTCAELTKTVSVSQATNNGLLVSQTEYNITNAAQQLELKVQANVKFSVEVDNGCKNWVKYKTTKGLTTSTVVLDIAKNESYDNREGKVTIKQDGGNLSSTIIIKQGQTNGLFLTTSEYNLSNEKHTLTVEVKSNIEFEVKSEVGWIKYVETKGLKTNQIILDVEANETYDTREGKVTVKQKNGDLTGTITIRQDQNYGILVTQSEYNLTNEAQTIDVEIKYNVEFDVIIPEECKDWISFVSTKSLDSRTYTFYIANNETFDNREGSITFKQKNGPLSSTVKITQSQNNGLFVTTPEYSLSNEQHTLTVDVKANVDFEVKSEVGWITVVGTKGLKTSQITLDIERNESYDCREGKVTVRQKNGNLTGAITVRQAEKTGLILSQTEFKLDNAEHIVDVEVQSNVEYDIVIPEECSGWISAIGTKGLSTRTCSFAVAKNEGYDGREGSITFKQKNGPLSGTVSVKQSQNNGLFVTKSDYEINNESQTVNVEVKANIDFEVKSESDWVKVVETKGLKTSTIVLSIEENDSYDAREGKVSVTQNDGDLKGTITIKQKGKNGIVLPQTEYELTNEAQTLNVEVQSTVQFEVEISDSGKEWVSLASTKVLDTKTCTFYIKKNDTYDSRECTVSFRQVDGAISNSISIKQSESVGIVVSQTEYNLNYESQIVEIIIETNVDYEVYSMVDWIKLVETKGLMSSIISLSVDDNESFGNREGIVLITQKGGSLSKAITIRQASNKKSMVMVVESNFSSDYTTYLPLAGDIDCEIDWGDGILEHYSYKNLGGYAYTTTSVEEPDITLYTWKVQNAKPISHKYPETDSTILYEIKITGKVTALNSLYLSSYQNNSIIEIKDWGNTGLKYMCNAFIGQSKLRHIASDVYESFKDVISFGRAFEACDALDGIPNDLFQYSINATDFYGCFLNNQAIQFVPEGLFRNCKNAISMGSLFCECHSLKSLPAKLFSGCDNVKSFSYILNRCTSLEDIPSDIFLGAPEAKYMRAAFAYTSIKSIDNQVFASNKKITNFCQTFSYCSKLEAIPSDLFKYNTEARSFESTFAVCSSLSSIPASIFDANRKVDNFYASFASCTKVSGESPYTIVDGVKYHLYERGNNPNVFHTPTNYMGCFKDCSNLLDYDKIPNKWKIISF